MWAAEFSFSCQCQFEDIARLSNLGDDRAALEMVPKESVQRVGPDSVPTCSLTAALISRDLSALCAEDGLHAPPGSAAEQIAAGLPSHRKHIRREEHSKSDRRSREE